MHTRTVAALCCLVPGLAACVAREGVAPPPAATVREAVIRGTATYAERVKMPAGASLRVDLIDAGDGRPIATSIARDAAGPPYPFSIERPGGPTPAGGYALRATLLGPTGERWFETAGSVPAPRGSETVELRLRRVEASEAPGSEAPTARPTTIAHWECGELGVMSRYDLDARTVRLSFNGTDLRLPIAGSGSGARYADTAGDEFRTQGETGRLTLAGEPARDCAKAAQASPWNLAAQRGVAFRAGGNEPGWFAEISGDPPVLRATLDYGERALRTSVKAVGSGYDGRSLRLRIEPVACRDGMSGQAFEATVTLQVDGRAYRGCGAWLQD